MPTLLERISAGTAPATFGNPSNPGPDLSALPGFSSADIQVNETGVLSKSQREQVRKEAIIKLIASVVGGVVFLIFSLASGVGPQTIVAILFLGVALWEGLKYAGDLSDGKVLVVEGDVRTEVEDGGECANSYWLYIGDLKLSAKREEYEIFSPGGPFRIFYLPITRKLVSAKALAGWRRVSPPVRKRRPWWSNISIEIG